METLKAVNIQSIFIIQLAIWLELFRFSDKWNRFGTWQHLEINDPSQG